MLLQVLVHRSHDLLKDEIVSCIFDMAKVDFVYFFNDFIAHFLANTEGIDNGQQSILKNNLKHDKVRRKELEDSQVISFWLFR